MRTRVVMLIRPDVDFGALFYQLFFKLYQVYKLFPINSLIQVSWAHLATFHGLLTGFSCYVRNKHFSWTWGVNRMLKILKTFRALNVSKPLWFHDLNITIKIKTAVMINTAPMMKMQMIFLMRMKKFQKSFFHSDVEGMVQVGEIALTKSKWSISLLLPLIYH